MIAKCKTCGNLMPGPHRPSPLDPNGVGDPGHITSPTRDPEQMELEDRISRIMEGYRRNASNGRAWELDMLALIATRERQARIDELRNALTACQTRHPMESIDYLEARLATLNTPERTKDKS